MNTNQYTQKTLEALQAAQQLAVEYQHNALEPEHLLHALASQEQGLIPQLLQKLNVDPGSFAAAVAEKLSALPRVSGSGRDPDKVYISQATDKVLSAAAREAKAMKDEYVSVEHVFLGLLDEPTQNTTELFRAFGIAKDKFLQQLTAVRGNQRVTTDNPEDTYNALQKYGQDLVDLARKQKLDPVIGRDQEIRNVIRILSRKTKNNPCLIGEPGVGKTAVIEGLAVYALLPVENSFAGAVLPTYSLLEKLPLHIVGETMKAVRHNLLGVPGATLAGIRRIASHPQAIAQCDVFLQGLKGVQITPSENTAISARDVAAQGDLSYAAIASEEAARSFGLIVLAKNIQTSSANTTRFLILSRTETPLATPSKATVVFTVKNEVGALVRVLASFAESGLNMSRIESRPMPETPFQYFFSADFEGSMDAEHLSRAMEAARPYTCELRLLGVYPKAIPPKRENEANNS